MKKMITLIQTIAMMLMLFGCEATPEETVSTSSPPIQPPNGFICLDEEIEGSDIECACDGDRILLTEDGLIIELYTTSNLVYRDGYITAVMEEKPVANNGRVFVHEDFYHDYLCGGDTALPSLFHGTFFFAVEILDALDQPDASVFNQKLLLEVSLPTSMNIDAHHVDMDRVFQDTPLSEYPADLTAELLELGYQDAATYHYSEYSILVGSQTLAQAGISNDNNTTIAEYHRQQHEVSEQKFKDELSKAEAAFATEKQIELTDLAYLDRIFNGAYMDETDENLRIALEEYYVADINYLNEMVKDSTYSDG